MSTPGDANDTKRLEGMYKQAYAKPSVSKKKRVFDKIQKAMGK